MYSYLLFSVLKSGNKSYRKPRHSYRNHKTVHAWQKTIQIKLVSRYSPNAHTFIYILNNKNNDSSDSSSLQHGCSTTVKTHDTNVVAILYSQTADFNTGRESSCSFLPPEDGNHDVRSRDLRRTQSTRKGLVASAFLSTVLSASWFGGDHVI